MSFADATIERLPGPLRPFAERHHELIKFAIVGATTFVIDMAVFFTLKLTILEPKPVTAKIIAGIVAVIASYILNREWLSKLTGNWFCYSKLDKEGYRIKGMRKRPVGHKVDAAAELLAKKKKFAEGRWSRIVRPDEELGERGEAYCLQEDKSCWKKCI